MYDIVPAMNTLLRNTIIALVFAILLVPFVVSTGFFFPFITGKAFAFRILVELAFGLWVILALRNPEYQPKFSWLGAAFVVFVALIGIADLMSPNPLKSFWSNFERMEGLVTLIHLFAYFLVASSIFNSEKWWTRFFQASVGASVIMGMYGILQLAGKIVINQGGVRLDGTLGNATYLAAFMLLNFFITLFLLIRNVKHNSHSTIQALGAFGVSTGLFLLALYIFKFSGFSGASVDSALAWSFLTWLVPICAFVLWQRRLTYSTLFSSAIILQLYIIYATETRGAVIGLFVGIFLSSLLVALGAHRENEKVLRRVAVGVLILCAVVPVAFFALRGQPFMQNNPKLARFVALANTISKPSEICEGEFKSRCLVWPMAWKGFQDRPILGWGQESFNYVFNKYYDPRMYAQEQWFDRTHNVILDWLIAGGALGLLAYFSLFVLALYYIWRQGDFGFKLGVLLKRLLTLWKGHEIAHLPEKSILTGLLVAYFIYNLSVFDNITSYILFFSVLAYVHSISAWPIKRIHERALDANIANLIMIPLTVAVIGFVMYTVNIIPMRSSATLIDALRPQKDGPSVNLALFEKALAFDSLADSEIREQLAQKSIEAMYTQSVSLDLRQRFYEVTYRELKKQTEETPEDARYYLFLGSFLNRARNYDEAVSALEKALALSPKKQTIMFETAMTYINKQDYANALAVVKRAFDLEPDFKEARIIYAATAIYAGDYKLASELIAPFAGTSLEYDDRLLQAYGKAGKIDMVIGLLEKRVAAEPLDSQARLSLAGSYLNNGQRTKAVETLRAMAKDFPDQASQIDYFIREIQAGRNP